MWRQSISNCNIHINQANQKTMMLYISHFIGLPYQQKCFFRVNADKYN